MTEHPPGATLHLGGDAWAAPALEPLLVPIDSVTPWPGNPRRHDQDGITSSIRDHGLYAGITTQASTNRTLVGHGRYTALVELGATRVPATPMDVDDIRGAAIVARDNKTHDDGGYDSPALLALLDPFLDDEQMLALTGFAQDEAADLQRMIDNLRFAEEAGETLTGEPVLDITDPIDVDSDAVRVTVTVDVTAKATLYALLAKQPWVRDVADAHTRKPVSG